MAMPDHSIAAKHWREPLRVWGTVLVTLFSTEALVMAIMPWFLPSDAPKFAEALMDALILTSVAAPVLWIFLVRPLHEANRLRNSFLSDLFSSIEADRRQVAHELHDGVGQSLTVLISGLRSVVDKIQDKEIETRCGQLKECAIQALLDVRRLTLGLRPSLLDDFGLAAALQRIVEDFRQHDAITIQLDTDELSEIRLPENVETTLFRIAQEALTNVVRHAKANRVSIRVSRDDLIVTLQIEDDGVGIDPSKLSGSNPGHLGIVGMRERVALIGGKFEIRSQNGSGTRLRVSIPIAEKLP